MNFEERISNLIHQAKGLPYRDKGQLDEFRAGVRALIIELFGDKSDYLNDLAMIKFAPVSFYSSAGEYAASWNEGVSSVVHLLNKIMSNPVIGASPQIEPEIQKTPKVDENHEDSFTRMEQAVDSLLDTKAINEFANKSSINEDNIVVTESSAPKKAPDKSTDVKKQPKISKVGEFKNSLLSVFKVVKSKPLDQPSTEKEKSSKASLPSTPHSQAKNQKEEIQQTSKEAVSKTQKEADAVGKPTKSNEEMLDLRQVDPYGANVDQGSKPSDDIADFCPGEQHTANKVFVLHDTEETIKNSVVDKLSRCGLFPIVLKNRQNISKSLTQKLTEFKDVKFAVVILSDSEMAYPKTLNANESNMQSSQSLIFELGFWVGHLGRERVFVLYPDTRKFVRPTEYFDVFYQLYDKHGNWFMELIQKLKKCGFKLSL